MRGFFVSFSTMNLVYLPDCTLKITSTSGISYKSELPLVEHCSSSLLYLTGPFVDMHELFN